MAGADAMKGACGQAGCMCRPGCSRPGCMCGSMPGRGGADGAGIGNPMMKVFLDETKDLRKELHIKRFDYAEASRDFDIPVEDLMKMEKEIRIIETVVSG